MRPEDTWVRKVLKFTETIRTIDPPGFATVAGKAATLYGTSYGLLTRHYLGVQERPDQAIIEFMLQCQDPQTGYFLGPELGNWAPPPGAKHDQTHVRMHLTCATIPALQQFGVQPRFPLRFAHSFLDPVFLVKWLDQRNLADAWLEGNNLLFVGQLLIFLRDVEREPRAQHALDVWFDWLDARVDPATGLWGSDRGSSIAHAVFGGYHQLLAYYYEQRRVKSPERLVDTVLNLQHPDGGFRPNGGGGACEDVDAVDILVNLYKLLPYRRSDIRLALRRCMRSVLSSQNNDGGFPYNQNPNSSFSHFGIPDTAIPPRCSGMFPTWFRTHTLALIAQIVPGDSSLRDVPFQFSSAFSMGWHRTWDREAIPVPLRDRPAEIVSWCRNSYRIGIWRNRRLVSRLRKRAGSVKQNLKHALGARYGG